MSCITYTMNKSMYQQLQELFDPKYCVKFEINHL